MVTVTTRTSAPAKIMIVDDHPLIRHGLAALLSHEPDLEVCETADDVEAAWAGIEKCRPALVLMDLTLKDGDGLELIRSLKAAFPDTVFLALSMHDEKLYAERALRAGAAGYVEKQASPETVLKAVREVLAGRVYVSPAVTERFLHHLTSRLSGGARTPLETLSDRELEVLDLLGGGLNTAEIAVRLHLSKKTIQSHRERLKLKLGLKSASELLGYAVARHLGKG